MYPVVQLHNVIHFNQRIIYTSIKHLSNECRKLFYCKLNIPPFLREDKDDSTDCLSNDWLISNNCSMDYISFPTDPLFIGYFQVIYSRENLIKNLFVDTPPDYVCNHPEQCPHLPETTLRIQGLDCRPFKQISNASSIVNLYSLYSALDSSAQLCMLMDANKVYQSNSSLFYCQSSNKYHKSTFLTSFLPDSCFS